MSDKIYIGIDNKRIEAKGEQLDYILQAQADAQESQRLIEAETTAKAQAKESAMAKLRKLGLTDDEIAGLIS
jgi:type VI protein secretion system component Hcp